MKRKSETSPTRVVIADDHPMILATLVTLLASIPEVQVVAKARSAEELIECLAKTNCDILVTDYSMPGDFADGLSLIRGIRRDHPQLPIAVVTMMANSAVHIALMKSGVLAIVDKASDVQDVVAAVQAVRRGREYVSQSFRTCMARFPKAKAGRRLTPREAEVFRLFVSGLSVSAIAQRCARSVKTISRQKLDGMKKLGLKSDVELFEYAREHGLG
ncbi:response regulator [Lysobacter terrae]